MFFRRLKISFFSLIIFPALFFFDTNKAYSDNSEFPSVNYLNKSPEDEYILGEGDVIKVIIQRNYPNLNGTYTIDSNGYVYLPKLERVFISGLTTNELKNILQEKYKEIFNFPKIEIDIIRYRPIKIYIDGEVTDPGRYTLYFSRSTLEIEDNLYTNEAQYSTDLINQELGLPERVKPIIDNAESRNYQTIFFPTLFDAIQKAGGLTTNSDLSNVEIIRKDSLSNGGGKKKATINFLEYLTEGNELVNVRVFDGDRVKIQRSETPTLNQLSKAVKSNLNPKFIKVFVRGRVDEPGLITVNKQSTLTDAVESAGGAKFVKGKVKFIRFNNDGTIEKRKFAYRARSKDGSYKNPFLRNGDLIIVGKSPINIANEIITDITGPMIGIYSTYKIFD